MNAHIDPFRAVQSEALAVPMDDFWTWLASRQPLSTIHDGLQRRLYVHVSADKAYLMILSLSCDRTLSTLEQQTSATGDFWRVVVRDLQHNQYQGQVNLAVVARRTQHGAYLSCRSAMAMSSLVVLLDRLYREFGKEKQDEAFARLRAEHPEWSERRVRRHLPKICRPGAGPFRPVLSRDEFLAEMLAASRIAELNYSVTDDDEPLFHSARELVRQSTRSIRFRTSASADVKLWLQAHWPASAARIQSANAQLIGGDGDRYTVGMGDRRKHLATTDIDTVKHQLAALSDLSQFHGCDIVLTMVTAMNARPDLYGSTLP